MSMIVNKADYLCDKSLKDLLMISLNVVLKARPGHKEALYKALCEIGEYVNQNEPNTIGFYVSQDTADPLNFITYERFIDQKAMDEHNNSAYRVKWGKKYDYLFDKQVKSYVSKEIYIK